jgi:thiamine biosynthesis lipoprotein
MLEVLHEALHADRNSGGLVSPLVLGALETSGYSHSFDELHPGGDYSIGISGKNAQTVQVPTINSTTMSIQLNAKSRTVKLPPGERLDLGGVAKGWAADRAARRLSRLGPALVDAGGDIAVSGPMADGDPWPVGVTDPFDPEKQVDLLLIDRGGVATSGRDYRRWLKDRIWQHHIIDPRSGRPAQTDVLTATVVAPNTQAAEMAAKVVLILGSWQGIPWLEERPALAGLLVLDDGEIVQSRRWMDYMWR